MKEKEKHADWQRDSEIDKETDRWWVLTNFGEEKLLIMAKPQKTL